eukprot:3909491-Prymnesium_polylepis.1
MARIAGRTGAAAARGRPRLGGSGTWEMQAIRPCGGSNQALLWVNRARGPARVQTVRGAACPTGTAESAPHARENGTNRGAHTS